MTHINEARLAGWATPPSESELERCANTERMVCDALNANSALRGRTIKVFAQGSYRNRTNVRRESDVDICVVCTDVCFPDYRLTPGVTNADVGLTTTTYTYSQFKNEVGRALAAHFGPEQVRRGNKAFDVHASSHRVSADVVPCFEYRRYEWSASGQLLVEKGTAFDPDSGSRIHNWPEQHYSNGVAKNDATGRAFKATTRVLKNLRNEMVDAGRTAAQPIPSYLLECLAFNTPNGTLTSNTWTTTIKDTLRFAYAALESDTSASLLVEVNGLKPLMLGGQPWTREQTRTFVLAAWDYAGF